MNITSRSGPKPVLWLVLALLLTLALALPAQAAVTDLQVKADNPTLGVKSDYTLTFKSDTAITAGDTFYLSLDFDISEVDLNNVKLTVNDADYTGEVGVTDDGFLRVAITSDINVDEEITLLIPGVVNPSYYSNGEPYSFGLVINHDSGERASVELYPPTLTITPDHDPIEVMMRDKITIGLKDYLGNDFNAPFEIGGTIYGIYGSDEFYAQPTDAPRLEYPAPFKIPQGNSCVEVYYRPTWAGENTLSAEVNFGGADIKALKNLNVIPAGSVQTFVNIYWDGIGWDDKFIAGQPNKMIVSILDQYWNFQPQENEVTVKLEATDRYGNPVGQFLRANEQGMVTNEVVEEVVIQKGKSYVPVYFKCPKGSYSLVRNEDGSEDERGFTVWLQGQVANLESWWRDIEVFPGPAKTLVVTPVDGDTKLAGEVFKFNVELQDEYGNLTKPQQSPLTVQLKSTSNTGSFYSERYLDNIYSKITQITFSKYDGLNPENPKTFYYVDKSPSEDVSISAEADYLTTQATKVKILPSPAAITLTPQDGNWLVNQRGKVTIALQNADGSPYNVPSDLTEGINIVVQKNTSGSFFNAQIGGEMLPWEERNIDDQYFSGVFANIPANQSQIDLYYTPVVGANQLTATVVGFKRLPTTSAEVTAMPSSGVMAIFVNEQLDPNLTFVAGKASKINVAVVDQEYNPVQQTSDFVVKLFTRTQRDIPSTTGHFYANIDEEGNPVGEPINEVTIPKDSVMVPLYYYDTKATTGNDYYLYLGTEINPNYVNKFYTQVLPAKADQLSLKLIDHTYYGDIDYNREFGSELVIANCEPWRIKGPQDLQAGVPSGTIFPLEVSILDAKGNPVPQSSEITINLSMASAPGVTGTFFERIVDQDGNYFKGMPITQVKFQSGEGSKTVYFVANGTGEAAIKAGVAGLNEKTLPIMVHPADRLAIHFSLGWEWDDIIQQPIEKERNFVGPEERLPFIVVLTDSQGHPMLAEKDTTVNLSGDVKFYKWYGDGTPISSITIPKGCQGVQVFLKGPAQEGTIKINATSDAPGINGSGDKEVKVIAQAVYCTSLDEGWNTLSTPVALERDTLDQVIENPENIDIAYTYDEAKGQWQQIYPGMADGKWYGENGSEFKLDPQRALYVKMNGHSYAHFYAKRDVTAPPTRSLLPGWNLIGPAITNIEMKADEVLYSVNGKYSQAVSPGIGGQQPWAYVPTSQDSKFMDAGRGYWVYMKEGGDLAGFSTTPVKYFYYMYDRASEGLDQQSPIAE